MTVACDRTGRELTTKYATTAFGADRETVEEAFPGDVVGLVNATGLQLGDTIYAAGPDGVPVTFPPIPRFSPEVFATARPLDTGRAKQFRRGLEQLDEEGVVQVLRDPDLGDAYPVLAAVGALQFEVFGHRLASEFNAPAEILNAGYQAIRRTDPSSAARAPRDRRDPHPQPLRRRARRPVREPLPPGPPRGRRARPAARTARRRRDPRLLSSFRITASVVAARHAAAGARLACSATALSSRPAADRRRGSAGSPPHHPSSPRSTSSPDGCQLAYAIVSGVAGSATSR